MPVTSFSTVAANNNSAAPNGWPEGMSPSSVNDTGRQLMADIAREAQINAVKKLNSVAGTNTITADMDPELASYAAGMFVVLTPANNNTGATTLAIDGLTALDILKEDGDSLVSGDLVAGVPALLMLDSGADDFYLLNPQTVFTVSGTFTGTLTGMTGTDPTGTCAYTKLGNIVVLFIPLISGVSDATTMTLTGLPSLIQPARTFGITVSNPTDNSAVLESCTAVFAAGSGTITFQRASANWTASGNKSVSAMTLTYSIG
jgi:hypothetical protein